MFVNQIINFTCWGFVLKIDLGVFLNMYTIEIINGLLFIKENLRD